MLLVPPSLIIYKQIKCQYNHGKRVFPHPSVHSVSLKNPLTHSQSYFMHATSVYFIRTMISKGTYLLLLMFLLLNGPLLKAQSTLMFWVSSSVPSISVIAFCASSKFSYSISAYPCRTIYHRKRFSTSLAYRYTVFRVYLVYLLFLVFW